MKYNSKWELTVGTLLAAIICLCMGCGKEGNSEVGKLTAESNETTSDHSEKVSAESENKELTGVSDYEDAADSAGLADNAETGEEMQNNSEEFRLEGVTVSIFGDSISTYENWIPYGYNNFYPMSGDVKDINDTWWIRMFDETGMKLCANASSSGCTCAGDSTDVQNPQVGCSDFRITDLSDKNGAYPDIIVIFMGTNDLLENIPLGENDGTVAVEEGMIDNFADAYSLILDKLENYYPCSEIYCCTLLQVGDFGTDTPYVPFTNGQGFTAKEYSGKIRSIAENKGYPVIDLYNCGIETGNLHQMTSDGVHPNAEGMKYIAEAVGGTISDVRSKQ